MVRSRTKSLRTLEKVRSAAKQNAERSLAKCLKDYDDATQMLATLESYLDDYRKQLSHSVNNACTAFELESKRQFLDKLVFAKTQQVTRLKMLEQGLEQQREIWREVYKDHKVVADLADRIDVEVMKKREKDAQKELDEAFIARLGKVKS